MVGCAGAVPGAAGEVRSADGTGNSKVADARARKWCPQFTVLSIIRGCLVSSGRCPGGEHVRDGWQRGTKEILRLLLQL
eukprot:6396419-Pyramimonas_sp.AAC.1